MPDDAPRRRPGRPPVDEPRSSVSIWLRTCDRDRLVRLARLHEKSVSQILREVLTLRLDRNERAE